jgi:hypothetical protein
VKEKGWNVLKEDGNRLEYRSLLYVQFFHSILVAKTFFDIQDRREILHSSLYVWTESAEQRNAKQTDRTLKHDN